MLFPVPRESLTEKETKNPSIHNFSNLINIDVEIEIEIKERITTKLEDNVNEYECSFCQRNIHTNDMGSHEERHGLVRKDILTFKCLS